MGNARPPGLDPTSLLAGHLTALREVLVWSDDEEVRESTRDAIRRAEGLVPYLCPVPLAVVGELIDAIQEDLQALSTDCGYVMVERRLHANVTRMRALQAWLRGDEATPTLIRPVAEAAGWVA